MLCQKKTDIERIDSSINANGISAKSMIGAPRMITLIYFYLIGLFQFVKNMAGHERFTYRIGLIYYFKTKIFLQ